MTPENILLFFLFLLKLNHKRQIYSTIYNGCFECLELNKRLQGGHGLTKCKRLTEKEAFSRAEGGCSCMDKKRSEGCTGKE